MIFIPIRTERTQAGDDLREVLAIGVRRAGGGVREGDIIVVSAKIVATAEGRIVNLASLKVSKEAQGLAKKCNRSPEFCQAVLEETAFRNGKVAGTCPGAILTELRPKGLNQGTIFTANAGLDESNVEKGFAVGWPEDPVASVREVRGALTVKWYGHHLRASAGKSGHPHGRPEAPAIAVILSDSCLRPRRIGVTAFALTVSGLDPLQDSAGRKDLFGRPLRITKEAIADQLATAANMLMGNADQSVPAVIVRDHGFAFSDFEGWVPGIEPREDLFRGMI